MLSKNWDSEEESVKFLAGLLIELPDKVLEQKSLLRRFPSLLFCSHMLHMH